MKTYLTAGLGLLIVVSQSAALAAVGPDVEDALKKGVDLMTQEKYKEAAETFREAIRVNPDSAKAHVQLGAALAALHDIDEAQGNKKAAADDFETAILEEKQGMKLDPNYSAPHIMLGQIYGNQGKSQEAIAEFKAAIALKPNSFKANLDLGIESLSAGDLDGAIDAFRAAEKIKPDEPLPHLNLGILLGRTGKKQEGINEELEAIKVSAQASEGNPKKIASDAYTNLGNIYLDTGDFDKAKENFDQALKLAPGQPNALSGLGWVAAQKGSTKEGIGMEKQAIKSYFGFHIAHTRLAMLLAQTGNKRGAEMEFRTAMQMAPKDPTTGTAYAEFLAKNGKVDEAKAQYKQVLQNFPKFAPAAQGLASLEGANK